MKRDGNVFADLSGNELPTSPGPCSGSRHLPMINRLLSAGAAALLCIPAAAEPLTSSSVVTVVSGGRLEVDGNPFLLIGTAPGPPADLRTPEGGDGWTELAGDGLNVVRGIVALDEASAKNRRVFDDYMDAAAASGIYVWPQLNHLPLVETGKNRERLIETVNRYKDHPAVLMWKSVDEPEWGKKPAQQLVEAYRIMRELDPAHPVWICHAPRGTTESLAPYSAACDVLSTDIYPVSDVPGKHSRLENTGLSLVGDFTRRTVALTGPGQMPFMVLQGCWSGVMPTHNPKNTLMFPSFREERYMIYQAFICGANGFSIFSLTFGLTGRDYDLGWNWTYWRAVLRPILAEFKPGSELWPVMTAEDTTFPLTFTGAPQIEARWKTAGPYVYIFAAAREGEALKATFSGVRDGEVAVLSEGRFLKAEGGGFTDVFHEHDVHVYRALRDIPAAEVKKTPETLAREAAKARRAIPRAAGAGAAKPAAAKQTDIFVPEGAEDTTGTL